MEIQERVVMRLPLLMPAPLELERAGDPEIACVGSGRSRGRREGCPGCPSMHPGAGSLRCPQLVLHDYGPASRCRVGCKGRLKPIEEGNLRCLQPSACLVEIEPFDAVDLGECLDGA